jgi:hypothetical protein
MVKQTQSRGDPDWPRLRAISEQVDRESKQASWNLAKWRALLAEADEAAHGHKELMQFMAPYRPPR